MGNANRAVAMIAVVAALAACQSTPVVIDTSSLPIGTPSSCMAALINGQLVVTPEDRNGLLEPNGSGRGLTWPVGYSTRQDGGVAILDETGTVVAHVGDTVEIGGGEVGSNDAWTVCPGQLVVKVAASPSS